MKNKVTFIFLPLNSPYVYTMERIQEYIHLTLVLIFVSSLLNTKGNTPRKYNHSVTSSKPLP